MAPRDGTVKVGNLQRMGGGTTPPPPVDDLFTPPESLSNPFQSFFENLGSTVLGGAPGSFAPGGPGFVPPQTFSPRGPAGSLTEAGPVQGLNMPGRVPTNPQVYGLAGQTAGMNVPGQSPQATLTMAEYLASMGIGTGGGGAARPDFSAYRAALTDQAQQLNAQIQAMYNALGEEAGANVGRIQDIYGGASTGIGDVYGSAIGNVGDAYS